MTFQPRDYQALFRLLGDPSLYQRYQIPPLASAPTPSLHAFSLNFGVFKTLKEYVLEDELPGLSDRSKVVIEFVDAQTFLVCDKAERSFHTNKEAGGKNLKPAVEDEEEAAKGGDKRGLQAGRKMQSSIGLRRGHSTSSRGTLHFRVLSILMGLRLAWDMGSWEL